VLVLDLQLDTTTPAGRFTAITMANAAEFERRQIGERTRVALQAKKARGARLGRRRDTPNDIVARVVSERAAGRPWQAIADALNLDGVPTTRGGVRWRVSTVQRVYQGDALDKMAGRLIVARVVSERDAGRAWQAIADALDADSVPTTRGGTQWRVSTVQRLYQSHHLDQHATSAAQASAPETARDDG
jgi:Resolvase, N terminal domain